MDGKIKFQKQIHWVYKPLVYGCIVAMVILEGGTLFGTTLAFMAAAFFHLYSEQFKAACTMYNALQCMVLLDKLGKDGTILGKDGLTQYEEETSDAEENDTDSSG